jgi:ectoine hydroxylase-related dioxygenase (phytanoyl-CoA dioxygenase family)
MPAINQEVGQEVGRDDSGRGPLNEARREELRESFAANGYFILRDAVSKEKLTQLRARLLEEFDRARASGALPAGGGTLSGHLNCFPGREARFAYDTLRELGVLDLVEAIYPGSTATLHVGCNLNLPNSVTQHYHVDSAFLGVFMVVNVAVVDTDLVNGAIDVVPGTNRKFYKYWRFAVERPNRNNERLPLSQGDVLVRASTLWHRGMPNRSATPRPMLAFTFGNMATAAPPPDPFDINGGKILFYENWFRPTRLGRLRERTFVAAPFTYDAYRFVRSLFGNKGYASP